MLTDHDVATDLHSHNWAEETILQGISYGNNGNINLC